MSSKIIESTNTGHVHWFRGHRDRQMCSFPGHFTFFFTKRSPKRLDLIQGIFDVDTTQLYVSLREINSDVIKEQ